MDGRDGIDYSSKDTFWGDGNVLYFQHGDSYITLSICQIHEIIHKILPILIRILLYVYLYQ